MTTKTTRFTGSYEQLIAGSITSLSYEATTEWVAELERSTEHLTHSQRSSLPSHIQSSFTNWLEENKKWLDENPDSVLQNNITNLLSRLNVLEDTLRHQAA